MMDQAQATLTPEEQAILELADASMRIFDTIDSKMTSSQQAAVLSLVFILAKRTAEAKVTEDGDNLCLQCEDISFDTLPNIPSKFYEPLMAYKTAIRNLRFAIYLQEKGIQ